MPRWSVKLRSSPALTQEYRNILATQALTPAGACSGLASAAPAKLSRKGHEEHGAAIGDARPILD